MRRLVVCADGTWNTAEQENNGQPVPTNVTKMFRAVAPVDPAGVSQLKYHQHGVGTRFGLDRWIGGGVGVGLSQNVIDCYRWLIANYAEGDEIFLFGFSRGAYTARSLSGLIRNSGLLRNEHGDMLPRAYQLYRDRGRAAHPKAEAAEEFRARFSRSVRIKCIGVWDTVGALGIPGHVFNAVTGGKYHFHDVTLSSYVENAFHALAIDERRRAFRPSLWAATPGEPGQRLEQVWFPGVHSDVGGGYPECGLSDLAFLWMVDRASTCGLAFDTEYIRAKVRELDLDADEVHVHDSLTLFYRTLGGGAAERAIGRPPADEDGRPLLTTEGTPMVTNESLAPVASRLLGRVVQRAGRAYSPRNLPRP